MDLDDLRALISVIDHGSAAAAAAATRTSRTTLRRRLENLEAQVGVPLLIRGTAGAVPTPAGLALAARGRTLVEEAYRRIREIEAGLHLEDLPPEDALRKLVAFTVDYQLANPDFIRLVMTENIHRGEYLAQSKLIQKLNVPAIEGLRQVYERGARAGVFRAGLDPVDLHMSISALSFFNTANRHTFALIFKRDLEAPAAVAARRDTIVEMIVRFVRR